MDTITKFTKEKEHSSDWILKPEKDFFTHDELIDAYLMGKEQQKNDNQRILLEKLEANVSLAKSIVETLVEEIENINFKPHNSYLRINNITKFDAIFVVAMDDFISEKFDEIYALSQKLKKDHNNDTFYINFTFMPFTDNLNEKRINCEGFFLKYEKR